MKKISILLMLMALFGPLAMNGQSLDQYTFTTGQDQSQWITLSSSAQSIVASGDDKASTLTNIGFSFPFGNGTYTQFWANSNGIFSFSSSPTTNYSTQYSSSSNVSANQPKICGITRDMCVPSSGGYVKYELTGSGTSHILVCEFYLGATSSASSATLNWQVQLHESGSKVVIVYGAAPSSAPSSYQIGLSASSSDIILVNPSSHTATTTSTYNSTTYSVWPGAYRYYEFAVPTDPYINLDPTSATIFTGFSTTLTATYGNVTGTPTITWTSSDNNVARVTGSGTTATVTGVSAGPATITATMNGAQTATCAITVEDPHYCTPAPTSVDGTGMHPVVFGSGTVVNNTSYPTSSPYYGDYTSMVGAYDQGATASVDMSFYTHNGYSGYDYGVVIWVDWGKDYEFTDSDIVYRGTSTTPSSSTSPGTLTATFQIPANQATGDYCMRIGAADSYFDSFIGGTSTAAHNPCYTGSYTLFHDYTLRVEGGSYHVTCNATTNGTITVNHGSADAGETITVTATPDTNYELTALSYNDGTDHSINFSNNQGSFTMPATDVTVSATFSIMRNLPPYDLTVGTPGGHSVELGWTGVSTNTNHQCYELYFSTDPVMPQTPVQSSFIGNITATSRELTGLTPETTYYAWVRDNCGTDGYSEWVAFNSFTTDVACPAPTNVAASHVTNNSAEISWNGNAGNYNVRYKKAEALFFEGFESGIPSTWTIVDADGDGNNWLALSEISTVYPAYTSSLSSWAHDGSNAASSPSYYNTGSGSGTSLNSNNWLISPQIPLQGTLKFYAASTHSDQDAYEVLLSTTGTATTNFTTTLQAMKVAPYALNDGTDEWEEVTIDLSSYSGQGYIAIHHVSEGMYFLVIDDFGIYDGTWQIPANSPVSASTLTLTGLDAETEYEVQVQANCGSEDGTSAWVGTTFTTLDDCAAPYELEATNVTATLATLNWTGAQDNYYVRYRTVTFGEAVTTTEGFSSYTPMCYSDGTPTVGTNLPSDWSFQSDNSNNYTPRVCNNDDCSSWTPLGMDNQGNYLYMTGGTNYAVMPRIENLSSFSFKYACESSSYGTLYVGYITNSTFYNFTDVTTSTTTTLTTINLTTADINTLNSTNGACLAFYWYCDSNWAVGIDDITYTTQAFTYGEWVNKTNVTSPLDITNLTPSTTYEWQVQGVNCDGNNNATDWSEYVFFTTTNQYVKHIVGYSNYENNKGGWYLIASPIGTVLPTAVTNMIANPVTDYDLFTFDQNETDEWRNYKQGRFTELEPGKGYLYANKENVDLIFTIGAGTAYDDDGEVNLVYSESNTIDPFMRGWNLVGNPYGQTAWINNRPYYTLNDVGDEYVPINADDASIEPMEGIFVVATGTGQSVTFSTTPPSKRGSSLTINVNEDGKFVDRAIVDFNQNGTLPKFQFDRNHTKVYIPQDGQDYAIVCSKAIGALPVNFKAENNGTYSLSFSSKNAEFAYLHLVDNMTGADIDLLQTPSYSFEAKTTDYESRFKLVFATGDNSKEENFAFFSNGSFVINNEGEATLQVIDIMGRIIKSESINGCTNVNVNAAPGVYMLRLVNGDSVKVQKVVVK